MGIMCVPNALINQERMFDPLELELLWATV